jgi:hypothetical protein
MLSPTGDLLWYHYDETGYRSLYSVTALNNNTFTAFYLFIESLSNYYGGLVNYDEADSVLWDTPLGVTVTPPSWTGDKIVISTSDGGYVMCGSIAIAKTDSLGRTDSTGVASDQPLPPHSGIQITCAPNPFWGSANLQFSLRDNCTPYSASIYNIRGQLVRKLAQSQNPEVERTAVWNGMDDHGRTVGEGVYLIRVSQGKFTSFSKILHLK